MEEGLGDEGDGELAEELLEKSGDVVGGDGRVREAGVDALVEGSAQAIHGGLGGGGAGEGEEAFGRHHVGGGEVADALLHKGRHRLAVAAGAEGSAEDGAGEDLEQRLGNAAVPRAEVFFVLEVHHLGAQMQRAVACVHLHAERLVGEIDAGARRLEAVVGRIGALGEDDHVRQQEQMQLLGPHRAGEQQTSPFVAKQVQRAAIVLEPALEVGHCSEVL